MKTAPLLISIALAPVALVAVGTASPASAAELMISEFVGRIEVVTGDYDAIEARVIGGDAAASPEIEHHRDGDVEIVGEWDRNFWGRADVSCRGDRDNIRIRLGRSGDYRPVEDYPLIRVTAPRDIHVSVEDAMLHGDIGDIGSGEISQVGCGTLTIGNVYGDFDAGVSGSGDLLIGDVDGAREASVAGSGVLSAGHVGGGLDASIAGSGDLIVGRVQGGADVSVAGSGDVEIAAASGDIDVSIAGSGDVAIGGGEADMIDVSIAGSGDVSYDGFAARADVAVMGSGDVSIADATDADISVRGSGEVRVANSVFH